MITDQGDTGSIAATDTLSAPAPREEFSIGRIIPLHADVTEMPDAYINRHELSTGHLAVAGRVDGQPLPTEKISADFSFVILSLSLLIVTLMMSFGRRRMVTGVSYLGFRRQPELAPPDTSELFGWPSILRNIFTVLNTGMFATIALLLTDSMHYDQPSGSVKLAAILSLSFLAALMIRHLTCIIAAEVTGWKNIFREYMNVVYNAWFANAVMLFILNAIILFAELNNIYPFIVAGLVITGIFLIIRTLRLLSIFSYRHIPILYFILYLCALEVLPVLVILKILGLF
jgi:hypothetical protein